MYVRKLKSQCAMYIDVHTPGQYVGQLAKLWGDCHCVYRPDWHVEPRYAVALGDASITLISSAADNDGLLCDYTDVLIGG